MEQKINRQSQLDIVRKITRKGGGLTFSTEIVANAQQVLKQPHTQENRGVRNRSSRTLAGYSHLPDSHREFIANGAIVAFDYLGQQSIFGLKE